MDAAIQLKGGMCSLITLTLHTTDLHSVAASLQRKQAEAPALFNHLPCAIDLQGLAPEQLDLASLLGHCRQFGLLPIAVRNAGKHWQALANELQLADLGRSLERLQQEAAKPELEPKTKVLHANVRSGQQIYHDGDLTIMGSVSAGAEVLASGSIHIFGRLHGRALAGIKGNEQAIICVQQFDAELVSIAGQYKLFDEDHEFQQRALSIGLDDTRLNIIALS